MQAVLDETIQIISDFFNLKKEVSAVFLFGSYARGRQRLYSDVDLGILFRSTNHKFISNKLEEFTLSLSRMLRNDLDLIAMNQTNERLLKQIFSKGRCIHVNDPEYLTAFKMTAFSKIADYGRYQKQFEKKFAEKILE